MASGAPGSVRALMLDARGRTGATVVLDPRAPNAGQGGEGWTVPLPHDPTRRAKVYTNAVTPVQAEKLRHMAAHPPVRPSNDAHWFAWPDALLVDPGRPDRVLGFVMPSVSDAFTADKILNAASRIRHCHQATYRFVLVVAHNVAAAARAVHEAGYVIGDVNESNVMVEPNGSATLIDMDSVQVHTGTRLIRSPVGKAEYQAPEVMAWLAGGGPGARRTLADAPRDELADRFALGVLLFQLMFENSSPYTSASDTRTGSADRILDGRWPWDRPPGTAGGPRKTALPYDLLAPPLRAVARRCFVDGHRAPTARPSASEWQVALEDAITALRPESACPKAGPRHRFGKHLAACPWCAYAAATGADLYPAVGGGARNRQLTDTPAWGAPTGTAPPRTTPPHAAPAGIAAAAAAPPRAPSPPNPPGPTTFQGGWASTPTRTHAPSPLPQPALRRSGRGSARRGVPLGVSFAALSWAWWAPRYVPYPIWLQPAGWVAVLAAVTAVAGWALRVRGRERGDLAKVLAVAGALTAAYWTFKGAMGVRNLTQPLAEVAVGLGVSPARVRALGTSADVRRGFALQEDGDPASLDVAVETFGAAATAHYDDAMAHFGLGMIAEARRLHGVAARFYDRALAVGDPGIEQITLRRLARTRFRAGHYAQAAAAYARLSEKDWAAPSEEVWQSCALRRLGRIHEADQVAQGLTMWAGHSLQATRRACADGSP